MPLRAYQEDLLGRTRQAYADGCRAPCIVAPCGAGKTIIMAEMARCATQMGNRVLFIVHRKELCDQTYSTFKGWGVDMRLCTIGMVQTFSRRIGKMITPSLIITDENHHCLATSYRKIYDHWPDVLKVGVTATPVRLNGSGLGDINDKLIVGPTVRELIEWGNLAPFRYYAPQLVMTDNLKTSRGEYNRGAIRELFEKRVIWGDVIKNYNKLAGGLQAICYCSNIEQSQTMAASFCQAGITAAHLDANTTKYHRDDIISRFRAGEIKILCNVDLISEGFDVPDCSAVILLRPTKSLGLFIQQSMRCMRPKPGKTAIIIDHVGNVMRFGLPDLDRQWSLTAKQQNKKAAPEFNITTCPMCFTAYYSNLRVCPQCGHVPERQEQQEPIVVPDGELAEVKYVLDYRNPEDCRSMEELYSLAVNRGYKRGWAYYQGRRLGLL